MLVGIGCLFAGLMHEFKDCVYAETTMRVDLFALAVNELLGKIVRVDTTGEELGRVVVEIFGELDYLIM